VLILFSQIAWISSVFERRQFGCDQEWIQSVRLDWGGFSNIW